MQKKQSFDPSQLVRAQKHHFLHSFFWINSHDSRENWSHVQPKFQNVQRGISELERWPWWPGWALFHVALSHTIALFLPHSRSIYYSVSRDRSKLHFPHSEAISTPHKCRIQYSLDSLHLHKKKKETFYNPFSYCTSSSSPSSITHSFNVRRSV